MNSTSADVVVDADEKKNDADEKKNDADAFI